MMLEHDDHLDESEQLGYVDGGLGMAQLEAVEQHLAVCEICQDSVDDLAEASDGLTAFLNQSDFKPRALVYRGARRRGLWINPWAAAASVAILLSAAAVARMLDGPPEPGWVIGAPAVFSVPVKFQVNSSDFNIEVSSWQADGSLRLIFGDTDTFSYRTTRQAETSLVIDTDMGLMEINTPAGSDAIHEVTVPRSMVSNLMVRVAGETVRFADALSSGMPNRPGDGVAGGGPNEVTIDLRLAASGR